MKPLYEEEAKERQKATQLAGKDTEGNFKTSVTNHGAEPKTPKGETNDIVGKMVGVSGETVKRATRVLKQGTPEVINAVKQGDMIVVNN